MSRLVTQHTCEHPLYKQWLSHVGAHIQYQRKKRGITQEKLAEMADLDTRTIQKIEAGDITILITTLMRIHAALGCTYDDMLDNANAQRRLRRVL